MGAEPLLPGQAFHPQCEQQHEQSPQQARCGTGWGGVWTAKDDFLARRRRTKWSSFTKLKAVPPRLYVDNKTIIREVTDVKELRSGDHCLIAINLVRCVSPAVDHLISYLGSLELIYFYHHFIMMDTVHHIDDQGIPRTSTGALAEIMEYGNTIPEAFREVNDAISGSLLRIPGVLARFLFRSKSKCHRMALADYGDTPHIYIVVESLSADERARIVQNAAYFVDHPSPYHVLYSNCEHFSNHISRGSFTSPNVHFVLWNFLRTALCCVGLVFLSLAANSCYSKLCAAYPLGAMLAYYLFTSVPVIAQAAISYVLVARSVWRQYSQALISHDDCCHLLGKELGRMVVVGGGATAATLMVPQLVRTSRHFVLACSFCACAYMASDLAYNCFAHAVMRLVLLPVWGKVWLIGTASPERCKVE